MARMEDAGLTTDERGVVRCWWAGSDPLYVTYHDEEWGLPVADDTALFEKICLEGFQSGLAWITILRKRENFRRAFAGFDPERVAAFGEADVARLLGDAGIVRHQGKIRSAIHNAQRALALREEAGSLAAFLWRYAPEDDPAREAALRRDTLPAHTTASTALAKALKGRGWRFVGPTTVYAFMQAVGMVNDHLPGCAVHARVAAARADFRRPDGRG